MKKINATLALVMSCALLTVGCSSGSGYAIDNDEVSITQYDGVEIEKIDPPEAVSDEDVDSYIEYMLEENPLREEITDRAVQDGDLVVIDYTGKMDGEEFDGGSDEDYELEIGSGAFIEGFEDSIIGHEIGDVYTWEGVFPDDYDEDFAGKDVEFEIAVKSIATEEERELDDDFVKDVSDESETVDEYKEEVKQYLDDYDQENYEQEVNYAAWQAVLENTTVKEYDEAEVTEIMQAYKANYEQYADYMGVTYEEYITTYMGAESEDEFDEELEEMARDYCEEVMVTNAIADKEGIELTEDLYTEEMEYFVSLYGFESVEELEENASDENLEIMALNDLVVKWVGDHCVQVETPEEDEETSESEIEIEDLTSESSDDAESETAK